MSALSAAAPIFFVPVKLRSERSRKTRELPVIHGRKRASGHAEPGSRGLGCVTGRAVAQRRSRVAA